MTKLKLPATGSGPRVQPRLPAQVSPRVRAEYEKTVVTWGIPNNLIRTMAAMPQLALTEVDYANAFIFDAGLFTNWPKPGSAVDGPDNSVRFPMVGFIDRVTKELVINLVSLLNRSRYSITHHSFIGFQTLRAATNENQATSMLLHLVDAQGRPTFMNAPVAKKLYTPLHRACLALALRIQRGTGHDVTDQEINQLRLLLSKQARVQIRHDHLPSDAAYLEAYVDGMLVELVWCICHFGGLLNKWFTVLRVQDEDYAVTADGKTFLDLYNQLPAKIIERNNALLGPNGWGG